MQTAEYTVGDRHMGKLNGNSGNKGQVHASHFLFYLFCHLFNFFCFAFHFCLLQIGHHNVCGTSRKRKGGKGGGEAGRGGRKRVRKERGGEENSVKNLAFFFKYCVFNFK